MESCSDDFHTKRHIKHSKKLMMVCAELTNLDLSSDIGSEDLAIIGRRWSLMPSPMLSDVMHVRSTVTLFIKCQSISSNILLMTIWYVGNGCYKPISHPTARGHRFILAIMDYFSKWVKIVPLKEVKTPNVIKFIKHHVLYHCGVPWQIIHYNRPQFVSQTF